MSIRWTTDEKELVIEGMAEQLRKAPRTRYKELWQAGNGILAPDRQRTFFSAYSSVQTNPESGGMFVEARKRALRAVGVHTETATAQEIYDGLGRQQKAHIPLQQETPITWVPVPTPAPERTVEDFPFEVLLAEVIKRFMERLTPKDYHEWPESPARQTFTTPIVPEKVIETLKRERPIRIALCGPMADQFRRVKERINARKVELVWVDNQKTVTEQDFSRGLDHVIVTRFIRHAHTELAQGAVGKDRVHWTSQGTESIVATVSGIVPGCVN